MLLAGWRRKWAGRQSIVSSLQVNLSAGHANNCNHEQLQNLKIEFIAKSNLDYIPEPIPRADPGCM
jgi:hypothetical protein